MNLNNIAILPGQRTLCNYMSAPQFFPNTLQKVKNIFGTHATVMPKDPIESAYVRGLRFVENDVDFTRVFPLLPDMNTRERFTMAKIASSRVNGKIDCSNFARDTLEKFNLPIESESLIIKDLDQKTDNFVTEALNAKYGRK